MADLELASTFTHDDWTIRYGLHEPHPTPPTTRPFPTAVFIHGTPWSSTVFQPLARALLSRSTHRILLYDLPGYGQSQHISPSTKKSSHDNQFSGSTSVRSQASALAALLTQLNLTGRDTSQPAPAIIAHDIAGSIALRAHLIHGCDFQGLFLLDTNAVLPWGDGIYRLVREQPHVFLQLPPAIFEAVVRAVVRSAVHDPVALDAGWEEKLVAPWLGQEGQKSFVRQIAQADDADVREMLDGEMYSRVRCQVKIVWGAEDKWIPRERMEKLAKLLGNRLEGLVVMEGAGHLCMLDQPRRIEEEVFKWIKDL
ncbi:Protein crossbronx [Elsinoe australis]|uniref:Protein crossbronx n=1 Tax=Elsinoe australis TaxID=40998 RepID=A0A2P8AI65_9PEZI|nr:Protein crossbronx [Elsinoe australis]